MQADTTGTRGPKLLVVQVAGLGWDLLQSSDRRPSGMSWSAIEPVFPAVTCTVQATLRTATLPEQHGMIANGLYHRNLRQPMFWEQSSALVQGERVWSSFREAGGTVGMMFWQQSLGEDVDLVLSPKPVHKHSGGMMMDCYSQPSSLYHDISQALGGTFGLHRYWGPLASHKVGEWIVDAVGWVMRQPGLAPDLLLTYLPSLDYDLQRCGPEDAKAAVALTATLQQLDRLAAGARELGYSCIVVGDYALGPVEGPVVFPNRLLAERGWFATRTVKGLRYPDFHGSRAFAMVDHEIAHVFVRESGLVDEVRESLATLPGVGEILVGDERVSRGLGHANCGELVLIAEEGSWFAYPWWTDAREAPDFASHVDIHNKPGYDPCELFFGWPPLRVSQDVGKVRGSHGRVGAGRQAALGVSDGTECVVTSQVQLAGWLRDQLQP